MNEQWRPVVGWDGIYEVSDLGRIRSLCYAQPKIVTGAAKRYVHIVLCRDGRREDCLVHRLVALAFLGAPSIETMEVNHRNGNKLDNRLSNLEWVTRSENKIHAHHVLGIRAVNSKRLPIDRILGCFADGYSANSLSKVSVQLFGEYISQVTLSKIMRGQHWQQRNQKTTVA